MMWTFSAAFEASLTTPSLASFDGFGITTEILFPSEVGLRFMLQSRNAFDIPAMSSGSNTDILTLFAAFMVTWAACMRKCKDTG